MRHLLKLSFEQMVKNKDFQRFTNLAEACFKKHSAPYQSIPKWYMQALQSSYC